MLKKNLRKKKTNINNSSTKPQLYSNHKLQQVADYKPGDRLKKGIQILIPFSIQKRCEKSEAPHINKRKLTFRGAYYFRLHCKVIPKHHTTHCQHADATVKTCTTVNTTMLHTQHTVSAVFTAGNASAKRSYSFCVCKTSSALTSLTSLRSAQTVRPVSQHTDGTVSPKSMLFGKPPHTSQSQLCSHYTQQNSQTL